MVLVPAVKYVLVEALIQCVTLRMHPAPELMRPGPGVYFSAVLSRELVIERDVLLVVTTSSRPS